jgi:hypothetical protein
METAGGERWRTDGVPGAAEATEILVLEGIRDYRRPAASA